MSIYTPRGLKIRMSVPYAFGLMARLYPKVSPFRILKTTEGIESMPSMLAFLAGIICFVLKLPLLHIGLIVAGAQLIGVLINRFGFYLIPGLISLATLYSYLEGFGLFLIPILVIGLIFTGWQGLLAFFAGRLIAWVLSYILQLNQMIRYKKLLGYPLTLVEVHFINAYRLHASRIGISTDAELSDEEMQESHWRPAFEAFAAEWPQIVRRFTND